MSVTPATPLNIPQFIKHLDDPEVNQKFVIILRSSGSLSRPNAFKFEPDLYAHLINSSNLSHKDLVKHYYNIGIYSYPICAGYVIKKLFPTLEYNTETFKITNATPPFNKYDTLSALVNGELYNKPAHVLLDWCMEKHFKVVFKTINVSRPARLVVHVHIGNMDIGKQILENIILMLSFDNLVTQTLLIINEAKDYHQEIETILQQVPESLNYMITSITDFGTDIQPYCLTLHYLTKYIPGFSADYILKFHTKSDIPTMTTMLSAFSQSKLSSVIAHLDNPASSSIDIIGAKSLVMPNYHVKELLTKTYPISPSQDHNKFVFVAGSSFLSRFKLQQDILAKYTPTLIKQSLFSGQYYTGWLFDKNSPAHALERIIGGFESQANGNKVASIE